MKKISVLAMLLCSAALFAAELVFAENGKAGFTIVLPEKTAGFEEQAAKDLQEFFKKMISRIVQRSYRSIYGKTLAWRSSCYEVYVPIF